MDSKVVKINANAISIPKEFFTSGMKRIVPHISLDKNVVFLYPEWKFENIANRLVESLKKDDTITPEKERELIRTFAGDLSFPIEDVSENRRLHLDKKIIRDLELNDKVLLIYDPDLDIDRLVLCKDIDKYREYKNNYKKRTNK